MLSKVFGFVGSGTFHGLRESISAGPTPVSDVVVCGGGG